MRTNTLNKLLGSFSLLSLSTGSASGAILTATDNSVTPIAGVQTELILTIEDTLISGSNQLWGSVLLRVNGNLGTVGSTDNFSISVLEEDVLTDDVIFTTNITGNALSLNSGWYEYTANLIFDPATYQDENESFLALRATSAISLDLGVATDNVSLSTNPLLQPTVSAVPVPAAVWLFGSGLIGIAGVARGVQRKSYSRNNQLQPT